MSATLDAHLDEPAPEVWVPKPGHKAPRVTAMQVPQGTSAEADAGWVGLAAWFTAQGWDLALAATELETGETLRGVDLGDQGTAWGGDWIVDAGAGPGRIKGRVFIEQFEPESATPVAEGPIAYRDGPTVGGRWTLYDAELPATAIRGACMVTGRSPKPGRRFFSIGVEVTDTTPNGDVCLAEEYVAEMAAAAGMIAPADYAAVHTQLTAANAALADAHARIAELEATSPAQLDTAAAVAELQGAVAEILERLPKRKPAPATKQQQTQPTGTRNPQEP